MLNRTDVVLRLVESRPGITVSEACAMADEILADSRIVEMSNGASYRFKGMSGNSYHVVHGREKDIMELAVLLTRLEHLERRVGGCV